MCSIICFVIKRDSLGKGLVYILAGDENTPWKLNAYIHTVDVGKKTVHSVAQVV